MPDIAMCNDKDCHYRKECIRYMAEPNPYRQSYFSESPRESDELLCGYYIRVNDSRYTLKKPNEVP